MPTTVQTQLQPTTGSTDPLIEQSNANKLVDHAPRDSGSVPSSDCETPLHAPDQKNIIETKLEEAFGKEEHDREISGAGVGNHPMA